jgi:plastocyanin
MEEKRFKLHRKSVFVLILMIIAGVVMTILVSKNKLIIIPDNKKESVVALYEQKADYDTVKALNPKLVSNPNISNKEIVDEINFDKKAIVSHAVLFSGNLIYPKDITISPSDSVTWTNKGNKPVSVKGKDWGSSKDIKPLQGFSQEFDFQGVYVYTIKADDKEYIGSVIVK